jgi:hypothetical protein
MVWFGLIVCIVIAGVVNLCSVLLVTGSRASGRHASILLPQLHHPTLSDPDSPITIMTSLIASYIPRDRPFRPPGKTRNGATRPESPHNILQIPT